MICQYFSFGTLQAELYVTCFSLSGDMNDLQHFWQDHLIGWVRCVYWKILPPQILSYSCVTSSMWSTNSTWFTKVLSLCPAIHTYITAQYTDEHDLVFWQSFSCPPTVSGQTFLYVFNSMSIFCHLPPLVCYTVIYVTQKYIIGGYLWSHILSQQDLCHHNILRYLSFGNVTIN